MSDDKKPKTIEEVTEERDRYIARNVELERRLEKIRQVSVGLDVEDVKAIKS